MQFVFSAYPKNGSLSRQTGEADKPAIWRSPPVLGSSSVQIISPVFAHFMPGSLNNLVWTNFIAHTNDRDMTIWSTRTHSLGWPATPPNVVWNTSSLIWGMKGITALSPCWQDEGAPGQAP